MFWRREKRKSWSPRDRRQVWEDQFGKGVRYADCPICHEKRIYRDSFVMGHIRSLKEGGTNKLSNIIPVCAKCNLEAGRMHMSEYKKIYHGENWRLKAGIAIGCIIGVLATDTVFFVLTGQSLVVAELWKLVVSFI